MKIRKLNTPENAHTSGLSSIFMHGIDGTRLAFSHGRHGNANFFGWFLARHDQTHLLGRRRQSVNLALSLINGKSFK